MEAGNKVKELEDELKVLKAEIRNVLLDIRDFMLDKSNPLSQDQESAYLRMDLNTTAQAVAAEAAARAAGDAASASQAQGDKGEEDMDDKPDEPEAGGGAGPPPESEASEQEAIAEFADEDEPSGGADSPPKGNAEELEPPAESTDEPVAEGEPEAVEGNGAGPTPKSKASRKKSRKGKTKEQEHTDEPTDAPAPQPTGVPMYPAYLPPAAGTNGLTAWVVEAMNTIGPQQLERVIAVRRLWGNLPPSTCEALTHLQELIRSSEGKKEKEHAWLEVLQALEALTPS